MIRAWAIARQKALKSALAEDEATPLALVGGLFLWLLRLLVSPVSTLAGFRAWVTEECPVAPGRRARPAEARRQEAAAARSSRAITAGPAIRRPAGGSRAGTKTARFLALVADRHGPLEQFPLADVSRVSAELAPQVGLDPGAARAALRRRILSQQNGSPR